jgi:hypothetical protein
MKFNVTFRSTYPVNDEAEPRGQELATFFAERCRHAGIPVEYVDNHEDFAWIIATGHRGKGPYVLLGCLGDEDFEWLAQIISGVGFIGKMFGKSDLAERVQLAHAIHSLLESDQRFSVVRWHEHGYGEKGWSPNPD